MWTSQVYGQHDKMGVQKHTEHHKTRRKQRRNRHKENNYFLFFFDFLFLIFNFQLIKGLLQKMLNYRIGTVNEKHWGFKQVFRCSKPHTFSTFKFNSQQEVNFPRNLVFLSYFGSILEKKCNYINLQYISVYNGGIDRLELNYLEEEAEVPCTVTKT